MEDAQFVTSLKAKLERITDRDVELPVEQDGPSCLEYAAGSIIQGRHLGELEFHVLLARN